MEKIDISKLLKNCPTGMELDCTMYDNVIFHHIFDGGFYPIKIKTPEGIAGLNKYGCYSTNKHAKCVIFPKGKTTWEGFVPPCKFKDGDVIYVKDKYNREWCAILSNFEDGKLYIYVDFCISNNTFYPNKPNVLYEHKNIIEHRLATEEEKQKLFDAIKDNGYKWNDETKTLEKLVVLQFKVGDRIRQKGEITTYTITDVNDAHYFCGKYVICDTCDDNWELAPNKFDITTLVPFESKVLVRNNNGEKWVPATWGFYDNSAMSYPYECVGGNSFAQCIPYEGNEHLMRTYNECDKYYKIWK